jgi:hypothetical protein
VVDLKTDEQLQFFVNGCVGLAVLSDSLQESRSQQKKNVILIVSYLLLETPFLLASFQACALCAVTFLNGESRQLISNSRCEVYCDLVVVHTLLVYSTYYLLVDTMHKINILASHLSINQTV